MESMRTIVPAITLVLGVLLGWSWGASVTAEPPPLLPPVPCPSSPVAVDVAELEVDVALLRAEQEEGW